MKSLLWDEYDRWNDAVEAVLFPVRESPAPVYLDIEDRQLRALAEAMGIDVADVEQALCRAVSATLATHAGSGLFRPHTQRLRKWQTSPDPAGPPILALLAVFSLAAERMARGDGFTDGNFYGRLREALELPADNHRMDDGYRTVAERFWGMLNRWLASQNGERGLPTAFSVSYRFIGLSVSQALVRQADRERLKSFFRRFDLSPGVDIPPSELDPLLDLWITQQPSPATANLRRLWANSGARDRIAQAAAVALAAWDGAVDDVDADGVARTNGRIALTLELSAFPSKRFRLAAVIYAAHSDQTRMAAVISSDGEMTFPLTPGMPGALDLGLSTHLDSASMLEGVLRVRDELTQRELLHRPKRLVVFRRDQLSMRWIETEQVLLGDDLILVTHRDLMHRLEVVLAAVARPGWSPIEEYPGLPGDWRVIRGVEIFSHPGDLVRSGMDDLSSLIPLTRSQLKLSGGLSLPGATRNKWHTLAPPEIRAISDVNGGFVVRLVALTSVDLLEIDDPSKDERVIGQWDDDGSGALIACLDESELDDGDYRVELVQAGSADPLAATEFHLRSADTPDLAQWHVAPSISHATDDPLSVLGAGASSGETTVQGAVVVGSKGVLECAAPPSAPWWTEAPHLATALPGMRVARPDPSSCIYTGRHVEELDTVPTDPKGRPLVKFSGGHCKGCGLVRRYSTNYHENKKKHENALAAKAQPRRDVARLTPVVDAHSEPWDLVLDGLMHAGGGRWSLLERLVMHVEPTALVVDTFSRALEALGHLEVRRDPTTLQPIEWEIAPTALVGTRDGSAIAGYWPNTILGSLVDGIVAIDAEVDQTPQFGGPSRWSIARSTAEIIAVADIPGLVVAESAWRDLASALPPISAVVDALPRRTASAIGNIRWFDPRSASWSDSADLYAPGAYRLGRYAPIDLIRSPRDLDEGTMATSRVQLSKHAAAWLLEGKPMLAYNRATEELTVPLGADLPGLYERAVVLASGLLPTRANRSLVYHFVPEELAGHLSHLMQN